MAYWIQTIKKQVPLLLSIGIWGSMSFLLVSLAAYNQPSITDDFCFGWMGQKFGVLQGAYFYYMGWSGRYAADLFIHLNPLVFSSNFIYFQYCTYLLILLGFFNGLYFIKNYLHLQVWDQRTWIYSFLFQAITWYLIPGIYELFYWFTGFYYYLSFHLAILLLTLFKLNKKSRLAILINALLIFLLVGSSEISMIICSGVFFIYQILKLYIQKWKPDWISLIYIVVWTASVSLELFSPGNYVRAKNHAPLSTAMVDSLTDLGNLLRVFIGIPIFWAALFVIFMVVDRPVHFKIWSSLQVLIFSLFMLLIFYITFIPMAMALGEEFIPDRIQSLLMMYIFLAISFLILWIKFTWIKHRYIPFIWYGKIISLSLLLVFVYTNKNFRKLGKEFKFDLAKNYALENSKRFDFLKNSKDSKVSLDPIKNKNTMFFKEDISTNPKHLWCTCIAKYYGKREVKTKFN